jgi:hypothetical protein
MARGGTDPLVDALAGAVNKSCRPPLRVDALFGDQPERLEAIRDAYRRGISIRTIAETVTKVSGESLSYNALDAWLKREGLR